MTFILIVFLLNARGHPEIDVLQARYTKEECATLAKIFEAKAGPNLLIRTRCVGIPD